MTAMDDLKKELMADFRANRVAWRSTMIPQISVVGFLAMGFSLMSGYGMYLSIVSLRDGVAIATVAKASQIFVGGSSSILGFVVLKLFSKVADLSKDFVTVEKQFSSYIGKVRIAGSTADLGKVIDAYGKK